LIFNRNNSRPYFTYIATKLCITGPIPMRIKELKKNNKNC
jgi:hypothetical protein